MTTLQKVIKCCAIAFAVILIAGIVGGIVRICSFFAGDGTVGEMQTYTVSQDITQLVIDIGAADLEIKEGDSFSVQSNLKKLTVEEKNGCLRIIEKQTLFHNTIKDAVLTVTMPTGVVLNKGEITTGAGRVSVAYLSVNSLELELGAGEVNIHRLTAVHTSKIKGGAGKVTITDATLANLDLEMGVGELVFSGALTGNCDWECGVGATKLTLAGSREDYTVSLAKGLGEATVDGTSLADGAVVGSGTNKIDIEGGVGSIKIDFQAQ